MHPIPTLKSFSHCLAVMASHSNEARFKPRPKFEQRWQAMYSGTHNLRQYLHGKDNLFVSICRAFPLQPLAQLMKSYMKPPTRVVSTFPHNPGSIHGSRNPFSPFVVISPSKSRSYSTDDNTVNSGETCPIDNRFHPALSNWCKYLSMLWLKSIHVSKRGPGVQTRLIALMHV